MTTSITHEQHQHPETDIFGFWIYMLSDCILFASLFAVYAVLHNNNYAGFSIKELTHLPYIFTETMVLLSSSFSYGLAILALYQNKIKMLMTYLIITFLLGCTFVGFELNEFVHLYLEGHSWQASAALSAFFTLVGTHGLHVSIGLIWMLILLIQLPLWGTNAIMHKRLAYLGLFWAFLDMIWLFVFTIVYLMGAI
jgi:cytochrome o ubiquinol oxidase subunit III